MENLLFLTIPIHRPSLKPHAKESFHQAVPRLTVDSVSPEVTFEDVIAEPPSVRSFDKVWLWSHALFEVSRLWCYRLISLLLAVPVSLVAGILFAVFSCLHIWWVLSPLNSFDVIYSMFSVSA